MTRRRTGLDEAGGQDDGPQALCKRAEEKLQASERKYRQLTEQATEGIFVVNQQARYLEVNPAGLEMVGYSIEELRGMTITDLMPPDEFEKAPSRFSEILAGKTVVSERTLRRKDGSLFLAEITAKLLPDGNVLATKRDITERKRAEEEKQEALGRLQAIASQAPGVVYQLRLRPDGGFCFPYASDTLFAICRVSPEEVREDASKAFSSVHPDDFEGLMAAVQVSARDLTPWQQEFRLKFDDGVERWMLGNAIPRRESDGSTLWHGIITDITERKKSEEKLRESSEILERIFATTHFHLVLLDAKFNFIRVNREYADACGFPSDYFLGKNHFGLYPSEELESKFRRVVQTGEPYTVYSRPFEWPDKPQLGVTYWDLAVYPVKGITGEVEGLIFTLLEITERVRAEKALMAAKEEAERANRAKSIFLSSMSHEIRTPLTAIMGFSQLIASDTERSLTDFQKTLFGKVVDSGNQLLGLVNNVLDLVRIESGDIEVAVTAVDMKSIAEIALTGSAQLATTYGVKLSSKPSAADCYVMADMLRLGQVLTHLLSNAIQFNKKGGETILSWNLLGENKVRISISDEGAGISEDNIKNLYKPFDRLGFEGLNIKGFGVGLTLAKRLVELMGGEVGVESQVGKGSTFYIDLPAGNQPFGGGISGKLLRGM